MGGGLRSFHLLKRLEGVAVQTARADYRSRLGRVSLASDRAWWTCPSCAAVLSRTLDGYHSSRRAEAALRRSAQEHLSRHDRHDKKGRP